ncbi:hypothetical protein [Ileibacterium valens]|uniref:hypothetical protein n=1 Tax=Ileibacterium valens TaxID=1862668 RepID=UPI00272B2271|nr:hypothetical protein [Ileibacterium valens]
MNNQDILMVLPKNTIHTPNEMSQDWEIDKDSGGITIYTKNKLLGYADWRNRKDFGFSRPAINIQLLDSEQEMNVFEALISRLATAYEMMPSRYPLYIRLPQQHTSLIAQAARMGFIPYFGEWKESSKENSENDWKKITEQLRHDFPATQFAV